MKMSYSLDMGVATLNMHTIGDLQFLLMLKLAAEMGLSGLTLPILIQM